MRKILLPLLATTISLSAIADEDNHYYAGVEFGLTDALKSNIITGQDLVLRSDKHRGFNGGLFIGKKIGKTRFELEYMIRNNVVDFFIIESQGTAPFNLPAGPIGRRINGAGRQKTSSLMVNAWRTFAKLDKISLDAGIGLGFADTSLENVRQGTNNFVNDNAWAPAIQGMVQASYPFAKGADIAIGYRMFRGFRATYQTPNGEFTHRARNDEIFARVSWKFGSSSAPKPAPAPVLAPAPAPAPEPVKAQPVQEMPKKPIEGPKPSELPLPGPYVVYFDFDKSTVRADGLKVISRAAEDFRNYKAVEIKATGHADRAGAATYNMRLATKRAEAVKTVLIREGIPADKIEITSTGEAEPRVNTADGIREKENRAVVIVLVR